MVVGGAFLALLVWKSLCRFCIEEVKKENAQFFFCLSWGVEILAECKTWVSDLVSQQCCGIASVEMQKNKVSRSPLQATAQGHGPNISASLVRN